MQFIRFHTNAARENFCGFCFIYTESAAIAQSIHFGKIAQKFSLHLDEIQ